MSYEKRRSYLARVVAWARGENGQTLGEYALILGFVAMVAIIALTALGVALPGFWEPLLNII
jgi:Flp pilus assembly pilin Flp